MTTILLLEDDDTITFAIDRFLTQHGFQTICCNTIETAKSVLTPAIQIALLDLNLPDGTGYEFCRTVKLMGDIPVIFLTVQDDEQAIVKGLNMGADDYIVKPFQLSVLLARIQAVLRRFVGSPQTSLLCCGDIRLDSAATRVWLLEEELFLTATEYRLLFALLQNKNRTMTRAALLEQLWDIDCEFVNDNTLTVSMKRLRERLQGFHCIRTLRGIGYRMEDPS